MGIFDSLFKAWEPAKEKFKEVSTSVGGRNIQEIFQGEKENPIYCEFLPKRKKLNLEYNTQRDNKFSPIYACNVTMIQMALSRHYGITDDEIFLLCNSNEMSNRIKAKYPKDFAKWIYPDHIRKGSANEVFVVLLEALHMIMETSKYAKIEWNLTDQKIISEIDHGYPFGACGKFVGGHFILIIGYDLTEKTWIVNDPYGNWLTGYKDTNGAGLEYPMSRVKKILYSYGFKIHADKKLPV